MIMELIDDRINYLESLVYQQSDAITKIMNEMIDIRKDMNILAEQILAMQKREKERLEREVFKNGRNKDTNAEDAGSDEPSGAGVSVTENPV